MCTIFRNFKDVIFSSFKTYFPNNNFKNIYQEFLKLQQNKKSLILKIPHELPTFFFCSEPSPSSLWRLCCCCCCSALSSVLEYLPLFCLFFFFFFCCCCCVVDVVVVIMLLLGQDFNVSLLNDLDSAGLPSWIDGGEKP